MKKRRIYIIRHAKSSWKGNFKDHDRPLNNRGNQDAQLVSAYTSELFDKPDIILSSTAKRTLKTAAYFIDNWNLDKNKLLLSEDLYDFSGENLVKVVKQCKNKVNSVMIFVHNFAITDFVNTFGTIYIENVPTCGFVVIDFSIDSWENLEKGITVFKVFPKDIKTK